MALCMHRHAPWIALAVLTADCALAYGWMGVNAMSDIHGARIWNSFALSAAAIGTWIFAAAWSGARTSVALAMIPCIAFSIESIAAVDFTTREMAPAARPLGAWHGLKTMAALAFGHALLFCNRASTSAIMLFGLLWGLFPFLENALCGYEPLLGAPFCETVFATDMRYALVSATIATISVLGWHAWRQRGS